MQKKGAVCSNGQKSSKIHQKLKKLGCFGKFSIETNNVTEYKILKVYTDWLRKMNLNALNFDPFVEGVTNFKFIFHATFPHNFEHFGDSPAAFMLNLLKHPNLFNFWLILEELRPFEQTVPFFLGHPVYKCFNFILKDHYKISEYRIGLNGIDQEGRKEHYASVRKRNHFEEHNRF